MAISKIAFVSGILTSATIGVIGGFIVGKAVSKKQYQSKIDEAEAMADLWKHRAELNNITSGYEKKENASEYDTGFFEQKEPHHESRDYTRYYSRHTNVDTPDEEEDDIESINPKPNRDEPPRIVSQDEAMSPDSDCLELEYHTKDEALIDPNTPGKPDLIDEVDAFVMIGHLLKVPDPNSLPNTVYIYCPARDQYYEIFIYDNYWDPPEVEDDGPVVEKIRRKGRFDD